MDDSKPVPLKTLLRQVREVAGCSQKVLAEALGCSDRQVARWEAGQARPSQRQFVEILESLPLDERELIQSLAAHAGLTVQWFDPPPPQPPAAPPPEPTTALVPAPTVLPEPGPPAEAVRAVSIRVVPSPPQVPLPDLLRSLTDSVVCATLERASSGPLTPQSVRGLLAVALQRAAELELSVDDLLQGLQLDQAVVVRVQKTLQPKPE